MLFRSVGVPVLDPIGNRTVYDSAPLTFNAAANDPDRSGALTFSLAPGAPDGATITPGGRFTWTPADSFAGTSVQITIRVTDQNTPPLSDSETITISVLPNIAPVVQSFTVNQGGAQRSAVSSLSLQFNTDVSASLNLADVTLVNRDTSIAVPTGVMALTFNPATQRAILTFPRSEEHNV